MARRSGSIRGRPGPPSIGRRARRSIESGATAPSRPSKRPASTNSRQRCHRYLTVPSDRSPRPPAALGPAANEKRRRCQAVVDGFNLPRSDALRFGCPRTWKPRHPAVLAARAGSALRVLDRFHIMRQLLRPSTRPARRSSASSPPNVGRRCSSTPVLNPSASASARMGSVGVQPRRHLRAQIRAHSVPAQDRICKFTAISSSRKLHFFRNEYTPPGWALQ